MKKENIARAKERIMTADLFFSKAKYDLWMIEKINNSHNKDDARERGELSDNLRTTIDILVQILIIDGDRQ